MEAAAFVGAAALVVAALQKRIRGEDGFHALAGNTSLDGPAYVRAVMEAGQHEMTSRQLAADLDALDELGHLRSRFHLPLTPQETAKIRHGQVKAVYLCGNSLGLMPKHARAYVEEEMKKWEIYGVEGHFRTSRPWWLVDETVRTQSAAIVGAKPDEVVIMNTLSANLHFLMVPFYRPEGGRYKILVEAKAFPSDAYAVQTQVQFHGYDPKDAIIEIGPREGEETLRTEDFEEALRRHGASVALVLVCGVHYYTGQFMDIGRITAAGHAAGAIVGVDLAHAAGNVPLKLHDWDVDFAAWCTYKYINSGPGCIAGAFVHEKHAHQRDRPRFGGWWGHQKSDRFEMHHNFTPTPGAAGYQVSNPPVLPCATLRASLDLFEEAGMERLRRKSERITHYLEWLVTHRLSDYVSILTPTDPAARGCQLSLVFKVNVRRVYTKLCDEGVIVDVREPYAMRVAPAPLYNSFRDVHAFVEVLRDVLDHIAAEDAAKA